MSIVIKPHVGIARVDGKLVEDVDTGMDAIWVESDRYPHGRRVGVIGREPDSVPCLTQYVSDSELKEIEKVVAERNGGQPPAKVAKLPPLAKEK